MGEGGGTWYSRSIRLVCAREGDENLEGTFVPPMWHSDGFSPTDPGFNREKIQKRCTSSRAPTHQSFTTIIGLAALQCIFTRMQATCACAIIPTHIPFGGTKVSFEMKTCKNIPGREHIQSGIIILHGKNQWDNFSGKPNIH